MGFLDEFGRNALGRRESSRTASGPPNAERESAADEKSLRQADGLEKNQESRNDLGTRRERSVEPETGRERTAEPGTWRERGVEPETRRERTAEPGTRRERGVEPETRRERTAKELLLGFLTELSLIALAIWAALSFVVCVNIHYGNNMYPSIRDGDLVVTFRPQRPYLNAAVLYERNGKLCLCRVVAMSGQVVNISWEGALTVNGIAPAEEVFYPTYPSENEEISYPYTVGAGQVFILNDFRSNTADSRTFGGVDLKDVKGPLLLSMRRRGF